MVIRLYVAACAAAAATIAYFAVGSDGDLRWNVALGFGLLCFLAENFSIANRSGSSYSVGFVITIAAIISAGPAEAVLATMFGTFSIADARAKPLIRHIFNAAQLTISAGVAALFYLGFGGRIGVQDALLPGALLPLLAAVAVNFPTNTLLVSGAIAVSERRSVLRVWRAHYASLGPTYLAFALLGLLLGALYLQIGWASVLFLLMPLLVARHAFQAAIDMQAAFDDTVHSLMSAIEAKDPYTRGHAQRVSTLAVMAARAYGLSEERCRAMRYAALMHDVGKLTVLSRVLQKPGRLTPDEYEHMKMHPARGVELISQIDLLAESVDAVRHHHERFDGSGYPDGLAGDQIPLMARLIAVSDAFDSMTSTRTYRKSMSVEDAFAELHRWAGRMFDEAAIEALQRAVSEHGWTPAPEAAVPENDEHREELHARVVSV